MLAEKRNNQKKKRTGTAGTGWKRELKDPVAFRLEVLMFVIYLLFLLHITVFREGFGTHPLFQGTLGHGLFYDYRGFLKRRRYGRFAYLFFGNILWFVPIGAFLRRHTRLRGWFIVFLGFLFSLLIEVLQYIFGTGVTETDDLILNTIGTAVGVCIYMLLMRILRGRRKANW